MTIGLRVIQDGEATAEYQLDRRRVEIGRAPSNDVTLTAIGIAPIHVTLCRDEEGAYTLMTPEGKSARAVLVRAGEVLSSARPLEQGDCVLLAATARLEIVRLERHDTKARADFEVHAMPRQLTRALPARFAQRYLLAGERLDSSEVTIDEVLEELVALVTALGEGPPELVSLTRAAEEDEFHREVLELRAGQEARPQSAREPLSRFGAEQAERARRALETGESFLRARAEESSAREDFVPLRRDGRSLGYVMIRYGALSASAIDPERYAVAWRSVARLASSALGAEQARRQLQSVREENRYFRERERRHDLFKELVCESPAMRVMYARLNELVGRAEEPALILGEAGSGKALLARALHRLGPHSQGMLISLQCGQMSEESLGVELFGCAASELVGAVAARQGVFELARGGSVYLEEIDKLSMTLQSKLVRALKEGEVRRVGDAVGRSFEARLIVSSHRPIAEMAHQGAFRHDLYMALRENALMVPPLREREQDVMPLALTFLKLFARRYDKRVTGFGPQVKLRLESNRWPGNVRQLQTWIEAAVIKCSPEALTLEASDLVL